MPSAVFSHTLIYTDRDELRNIENPSEIQQFAQDSGSWAATFQSGKHLATNVSYASGTRTWTLSMKAHGDRDEIAYLVDTFEFTDIETNLLLKDVYLHKAVTQNLVTINAP